MGNNCSSRRTYQSGKASTAAVCCQRCRTWSSSGSVRRLKVVCKNLSTYPVRLKCSTRARAVNANKRSADSQALAIRGTRSGIMLTRIESAALDQPAHLSRRCCVDRFANWLGQNPLSVSVPQPTICKITRPLASRCSRGASSADNRLMRRHNGLLEPDLRAMARRPGWSRET